METERDRDRKRFLSFFLSFSSFHFISFLFILFRTSLSLSFHALCFSHHFFLSFNGRNFHIFLYIFCEFAYSFFYFILIHSLYSIFHTPSTHTHTYTQNTHTHIHIHTHTQQRNKIHSYIQWSVQSTRMWRMRYDGDSEFTKTTIWLRILW